MVIGKMDPIKVIYRKNTELSDPCNRAHLGEPNGSADKVTPLHLWDHD
jgi:hypothetical protein